MKYTIDVDDDHERSMREMMTGRAESIPQPVVSEPLPTVSAGHVNRADRRARAKRAQRSARR